MWFAAFLFILTFTHSAAKESSPPALATPADNSKESDIIQSMHVAVRYENDGTGTPEHTFQIRLQSPATAIAPSTSQSSTTPDAHPDAPDALSEAKEFYRKSDYDHALEKYRQALQEKPDSPDAFAGLTRVYLKKHDVDQADDTITKGLQVADSPVVRVALGEVYFREGKIGEAEREWVGVLNSGHKEARACLGLARVYSAISMNKRAATLIERAHQLDPTDPDITGTWIGRQRRSEQIKYLEERLAETNNSDAERRAGMQRYLDYIKARAKDPRGGCRMVSKATSGEIKLQRMLIDPTHMQGYGLNVMVNGAKSTLELDTGASGILISRSLARKAGLTKLSDDIVRGIGDKGDSKAYVALADSLSIGDFEFQNCNVRVLDRRSVMGEDGLIGADVFSDFLVNIDFPNEKLHLEALPKRPQEAPTNFALQTESEDANPSDDESAQKSGDATAAKSPPPHRSDPQDAYVAPEMKSFAAFYRFGHEILLPTFIGDAPAKLFMLDTGAFYNSISPDAAREVTKVQGDPDLIIKGLSGSVDKVLRAEKTLIRFGNVRQKIFDLTSFDLSSISNGTGTEVSGFLGFTTLRFLDIKIDYRDGLVDFKYDPSRWEH